jgi:hypothetical protein
MPDESRAIETALTAEEWKRLHESTAVVREFVLLDKDRKTWELSTHQEIALLNSELPDGDPRKITREDVALLRSLDVRTAESPDLMHDIDTLAAKLAALLPPEE